MAGAAISASPAFAQPASGPLASVTVAGTNIGDGTGVAITGGMTYRFNRVIGLGVEVTAVPTFTPEQPDFVVNTGSSFRYSNVGPTSGIPTSVVIAPTFYEPDDGRAVIFTTNLRLEIPTTSRRVLPYVVAGGGAGTVKEHFTRTVEYPDFFVPSFDGPVPIRRRLSFSQPVTNSFTSLALTLGGGVSFGWTEHLWVDADLRYLALLADRDRHVTRFGGGLSYRF
jgi:opacity protein-like surface antigen